MKAVIPSLAAVAAVGVLAAAARTPAQKAVEVGETLDHTFRSAPVNSLGVSSLKELRGKPVLVEFWGTR